MINIIKPKRYKILVIYESYIKKKGGYISVWPVIFSTIVTGL